MPDIIGQEINNRYKVIRFLGRGGMAAVYLAEDLQLERDVALKIILPESFSSDDWDNYSERFKREMKTLAKFNHPNIVSIYDSGEWDSKPFFIMEYLAGGTLEEKLSSPLGSQDAAKILLPIARALAYAHDKKVIHRDVKPKNILIAEDGTYKLADFGIMRVSSETGETTQTHVGLGIGTPEYMAPEQVLNQGITKQVDIYSLGITFFRMVTGKLPFEGDPFVVMKRQLEDTVPVISLMILDVNTIIEKLIYKMLEKDTSKRIRTMQEVVKELENIICVGSAVPPIDPGIITTAVGTQDGLPGISNPVGYPPKEPLVKFKPLSSIQEFHKFHNVDCLDFAFSPSGEILAAACQDNRIRIYSIANRSLSCILSHHTKSVTSIAFVDEDTILTGSLDRQLVVWDISKQSVLDTQVFKSEIKSIDFFEEGYGEDYTLIGLNNRNVQLIAYMFSSEEEYFSHKYLSPINQVKFSPNETTYAVALGNGSVIICRSDGNELCTLEVPEDCVNCMDFSPNGKIVVVGTKGETVRTFTFKKSGYEKSIGVVSHSKQINGISFYPDGHSFVTCSDDSTIGLWSVNPLKMNKKVNAGLGCVLKVRFSIKGDVLASASTDRMIRLWKTE